MSGEQQLARGLSQGLLALGLELSPDIQQQLLRFIQLLAKWNKAYNLTAVRDPAQMVTRHLLDCLAMAPLVRGPAVLDVGSGAGLPGLVLALSRKL